MSELHTRSGPHPRIRAVSNSGDRSRAKTIGKYPAQDEQDNEHIRGKKQDALHKSPIGALMLGPVVLRCGWTREAHGLLPALALSVAAFCSWAGCAILVIPLQL